MRHCWISSLNILWILNIVWISEYAALNMWLSSEYILPKMNRFWILSTLTILSEYSFHIWTYFAYLSMLVIEYPKIYNILSYALNRILWIVFSEKTSALIQDSKSSISQTRLPQERTTFHWNTDQNFSTCPHIATSRDSHAAHIHTMVENDIDENAHPHSTCR